MRQRRRHSGSQCNPFCAIAHTPQPHSSPACACPLGTPTAAEASPYQPPLPTPCVRLF